MASHNLPGTRLAPAIVAMQTSGPLPPCPLPRGLYRWLHRILPSSQLTRPARVVVLIDESDRGSRPPGTDPPCLADRSSHPTSACKGGRNHQMRGPGTRRRVRGARELMCGETAAAWPRKGSPLDWLPGCLIEDEADQGSAAAPGGDGLRHADGRGGRRRLW